jgi:hypothetical protein
MALENPCPSETARLSMELKVAIISAAAVVWALTAPEAVLPSEYTATIHGTVFSDTGEPLL